MVCIQVPWCPGTLTSSGPEHSPLAQPTKSHGLYLANCGWCLALATSYYYILPGLRFSWFLSLFFFFYFPDVKEFQWRSEMTVFSRYQINRLPCRCDRAIRSAWYSTILRVFFFFFSLYFISLFYFFLCTSSSSHSSIQVENCVQFREYYLGYPHLP